MDTQFERVSPFHTYNEMASAGLLFTRDTRLERIRHLKQRFEQAFIVPLIPVPQKPEIEPLPAHQSEFMKSMRDL